MSQKKNVRNTPPKTTSVRQEKPQAAATTATAAANSDSWIQIAVVLFITFILFTPTFQNGFVNWDDEDNLIKNEFLKEFNFASIKGIFTQTILGNYNPLPIFTFAIERALWGMNPKVFHINNVILHLLCTFFAYKVLLELKLSKTAALIGALFFGIHPMRVESVAWVTERKDVLFGAFYLPAIWLYIKAVKNKVEQPAKNWLILILFAFSLFAKIQAVALPLSMLVVDYYFNRKIEFKLITEKAVYFLMSLAVGLLGIYFLAQNKSLENDQVDYTIIHRLLIGIYSYFVYIVKWIFPYQMSCLYPYPNTLTTEFYIAPLFLIPFLFLVYRLYKTEQKALLFGILFFTVNVMFLLQILGAGQGFIADRFTYIPYLGLFFIAAWAFDYFTQKSPGMKSIFMGGLGAYFLVFAVMTWNQNQVWKNGGTLWSHVLKYYQNATTPFQNLGQYYRDNKEFEKALENFNRAIALKPSASLYNSRGKLFFDNGKPNEAIQDYTAAVKLGDKNQKTIGEILVNRGAAFASLQVMDKAYMDFNEGLKLDPSQPNGYSNRGLFHFQTHQYDKAIADYDKYLGYAPFNADIFYERAICKAALTRHKEALADFDEAIRMDKTKGFYFYERGRSHQALGNSAAAQQDFNTAKGLGYTR